MLEGRSTRTQPFTAGSRAGMQIQGLAAPITPAPEPLACQGDGGGARPDGALALGCQLTPIARGQTRWK